MSQWTDDAVDQLLDRSALPEDVDGATTMGGEGKGDGGGSGGGTNPNALGSLLQTFKVRGTVASGRYD